MPSSINYEAKPLPFQNSLTGISDKTIAIHPDKLYVGYVNKKKEIAEKLKGVGNYNNNTNQNGFDALQQTAETMATSGGKRRKFRLTHKNQNRKTRSKKTRSKK